MRKFSSCVVMIAAAAMGSAAVAAPVVDQSNYVAPGSTITPFPHFQTFTPTLTGALTSIAIQTHGSPADQMRIFAEIWAMDATGRAPVAQIGSTSFLADAFGLLRYTTDAFVAADRVYAIAFALRSGTGRFALGSDTYARGMAGGLNTVDGVTYWSPAEALDFGFVTTVDTDLQPPPPAVPEPAAWAMMIAGFALVGGAARRRRPGPALR